MNPSPYSLTDRTLSIVAEPAAYVAHGVRFDPGRAPSRFALPHHPEPGTRLEGGAVSLAVRKGVALAAQVAQRIAPWCAIVAAPTVLCADSAIRSGRYVEREGRRFEPVGGLFLPDLETVVVTAGRGPTYVLAITMHEVWHALEHRLSDAVKAAVTADLAPPLGPSDHPYFADPGEHRARAFEVWCGRMVEGMPAFVAASDLDRVFLAAWTGELGEKLA